MPSGSEPGSSRSLLGLPVRPGKPQAAGGNAATLTRAPGPRFAQGGHITEQNLDWPVSRETSSLFRSRTKMASFPYCEYHMLRLLLR